MIPSLLTATRIAELLGVPVSRIRYLLGSRPNLQPSALAGKVRLYSSSVVKELKEELEKRDSNRHVIKLHAPEQHGATAC